MLEIAALVLVGIGLAAGVAKAGWSAGLIGLPAGMRLGHIDGLRGYLALGVVFHHYVSWTSFAMGDAQAWGKSHGAFANNLGGVGVAVFFIITGFLFYGKVARYGLRTDWIALYRSRVLRLMPLYLFVLVLVNVLAFIAGPDRSASWHAFVAPNLIWLTVAGRPPLYGYDLTGLITAGVTWTLTYEVLFYLSLPMLAAGIEASRRCGTGNWGFLLVAAAAVVLLRDRHLFGLPLLSAAGFVAGMVARELSGYGRVRDFCRQAAASTVGAAALCWVMLAFEFVDGLTQYLLLFVFFLPIACGNSYFGALEAKASQVLGEISYSIYLLHGVVLYLLFSAVAAPLWWMPIMSTVVVILSLASFRFIEQPAMPNHRAPSEGRLARENL